MSKLPSISARECIRALQRGGFEVKRQTGSHIIVAHKDDPERSTVVPNHNPIKKGTLRGIMRDLQLSVEEFLDLL
jgi:predicted RNA binding protein YcfA (HicA-like mRNA interferase family)